jgi:hypothetical protein
MGKRFIGFLAVFWLMVNGYSLFVYGQDTDAEETKGGCNPFIPLVTREGRLLKLDHKEAKQGLMVEGTVFDTHGRSYAIVNGGVVEVGDTVDGFRVLKIEKEKVTFMKGDLTRVVDIIKEEEEK